MLHPRSVLVERVLATIRQFRMIVPGDRVAVACSGGPDSTALLLLLRQLAEELGCTLSVAHCNHRLRAEESAEDERFVRELAARLELPLHRTAVDVERYARQARRNLEQAAREVRYRFFGTLVEAGEANRVAVGHTADDQAETVLFRLLRGAGTRGLAGIYPVVEETIIRPLLAVRRQTLLEWLRERQQPWREDRSNRDLSRTRNRIRFEFLPLLEALNPGLVEVLAGTAEIAREEEAFWQEYLQPLLSQTLRYEDNRLVVAVDPLRRMPLAAARRVLRHALSQAAQIPQEVRSLDSPPRAVRAGRPTAPADFEQTQQLLHLALEGQSGSILTLPQKMVARKEFAQLVLGREGLAAPSRGFCYPLQGPGVIEVPEINSSFVFALVPLKKARYNEKGEDILDAKLAEKPLILRSWRPGDLYQPRGHWEAKKLKELFQRQRVSISERRQWPVLVAGGSIVWTRQMGVAEGFSPQPGSREALRIEETRGKRKRNP